MDGARTPLASSTWGASTGGVLDDGSIVVAWSAPDAETRMGRLGATWEETRIGETAAAVAVAAEAGGAVAWVRSPSDSTNNFRLELDGSDPGTVAEGYIALRADAIGGGSLVWSQDGTSLGLRVLATGADSFLAPISYGCGGMPAPIALADGAALAAPQWMSCSYGGGGWRQLWVYTPTGDSDALTGTIFANAGWSGVWTAAGRYFAYDDASVGRIVDGAAGATVATWTGSTVELLADPRDGSLVLVYSLGGELRALRVGTGVERPIGPVGLAIDAEIDDAGAIFVVVAGADALTLYAGTPEAGFTSRVAALSSVSVVELVLEAGPVAWIGDSDGIFRLGW